MPEGKPLFPLQIQDELDRNGISIDDAAADFEATEDAEGVEGDKRYRYGALCIYQYKNLVVMRHPEWLITRIWIVRR